MEKPYRQVTLITTLVLLVLTALLATNTISVTADGGPVVVDPYLWAGLRENQQTAVVKLNRDNTANIDLFVSMQDNTGSSHQITYFLPLGTSTSDFQAEETTSRDYDMALTNDFDTLINNEISRHYSAPLAFVPGTLLIGGAWLVPLVIPFMLAGCAAPPPVATLETNSSHISIYSLDENTDIED